MHSILRIYFAATVVLGAFGVCIGQSHAGSIFDQVTQSKNGQAGSTGSSNSGSSSSGSSSSITTGAPASASSIGSSGSASGSRSPSGASATSGAIGGTAGAGASSTNKPSAASFANGNLKSNAGGTAGSGSGFSRGPNGIQFEETLYHTAPPSTLQGNFDYSSDRFRKAQPGQTGAGGSVGSAGSISGSGNPSSGLGNSTTSSVSTPTAQPQVPRYNPYADPQYSSVPAIPPTAPALNSTGTTGGAGASYDGSSSLAPATSSDPNSSATSGSSSSSVSNTAGQLNNAINRGVQKHLQRGIDQGANAIDQIGRKVGLPGLGSILRGSSGSSSGMGSPTDSAGSAAGSGYSAPGGASAPEFGSAGLMRNHVNWDAVHAADSKRSTAGKAEYDAVARRAQAREAADYLRSAQQAEARGDWMQAEFAYRQSMGNDFGTPEDDAMAAKNHTGTVFEMLDRQSRDPNYLALNKKWAYCAVRLLNQDYSGQKTNVDPEYTEGQLHKAHLLLINSDRGNATWLYLKAVYLCNENCTREWNYLYAGHALEDALKCPRITPAVREKCLALMDHIRIARETQRMDVLRATFNVEQDLVWNREHKYYTGQVEISRERYDERYDLVHYADTYNTDYWPPEDYARCKKDLAENYPAFKSKWLKQLNENMNFANPSIAVPPAAPNEDVAMYAPARWEQLAFGPVSLTIGRKYPFHDRPGVGHFDPESLPVAYMQKFPLFRKPKAF